MSLVRLALFTLSKMLMSFVNNMHAVSSIVLTGHIWRQAIDTAETAPLDAMTGPKEFPTLLVEHQYHIQARAVIALLSEQVRM